jgi:4-amino-4-deoxy-L-arabinose transferase-like glycosyltransferase
LSPGAVAALITFSLGARLFGPRTGLVASFLFAIYPASIFWSSVLLSEALFTVPFAAAVFLLVLSRRRPTVWIVLSFGLALGYATIIRAPAASVWLVSIIFWWVLFDWQRAFRFAAVAGLGLLIWIVPVSIWNSVRTGEPQAVSTNGAFNLRIGHSPDATGRYVHPRDPRDLLVLTSPEYLRQRPNLQDALGYAVSHPFRELQLAGWKTVYLYGTDSDWAEWAGRRQPIWGSLSAAQHLIDVGDAANVMVLLLALGSIPWTFSTRDERLALWLVLGAWTAVHILFFSEPRYHLPLLPILLIMAARTLVEMTRTLRAPSLGGNDSP